MNSSDVDAFIVKRSHRTNEFTARFGQAFTRSLVAGEHEELLGEHTCIYAVGSAGRGEMSEHSDLDVFLVRDGTPTSRMDEVRLQASIVRASRELGLPDPSNDASYLKLHSSNELIERLGQPSDDSENTFTVRMLLLLESRPIQNPAVYERLLHSSVDAYWKYQTGHKDDHLPIVLINDIVRFWRNLLLNYESKTTEKEREMLKKASPGTIPPEAKQKLDANRWVRSYKLRFSRCLTCYSGITYLLAVAGQTLEATGKAHVDRTAVDKMVRMSPLERLASIVDLCRRQGIAETVAALRQLYAEFLESADVPRSKLEDRMQNEEQRRMIMRPAYEFGEKMFDLTTTLGASNPLYRYVVV